MKKVVILLISFVFLTGCVSVNNVSIKELSDSIINSKYKLYNEFRKGYKYYLPNNMKTSEKDGYNEVLKSRYYDYYLYVDLVAYYNETEVEYTLNNTYYYSALLEHNDKKGIINIYENKDGLYVINITYNYASIEVIVKEKDVNLAVNNILIILSSIKYNKDVVESILSEDEFSSVEEKVNIFDNDNTTSDYLDVDDSIDEDDESDEYNPDLIN